MTPTAVPLPEAFRSWLARPDRDSAVELLTCDDDGWPHVAHLSVGELTTDPQGLVRLALWKNSRGTANLIASARAALSLTEPDGVFDIRLTLIAEGDLPGHEALHAFLLRPVSVRDKSAPYARIVSGIRFALNDPAEATTRWASVRSALLDRFSPGASRPAIP